LGGARSPEIQRALVRKSLGFVETSVGMKPTKYEHYVLDLRYETINIRKSAYVKIKNVVIPQVKPKRLSSLK
jgi:hypothetical protein